MTDLTIFSHIFLDGRDYYPPAPKPGQRNKKNKKKTYELYVKIDIVSKYNQ